MSSTLKHGYGYLVECPCVGHAPDMHRIRVQYATWRIVDQTVGQRIWIRLGHCRDTADMADTEETRLGHGEQTLWVFSFFGLKKTLIRLFLFLNESNTQKPHEGNWIADFDWEVRVSDD